MNILFLLPSLPVGGVEIVSAALANKFVSEGHNAIVYCFSRSCTDMLKSFDERVLVSFGNNRKDIRKNTDAIQRLVREHNIDVVINQNGLSYYFTKSLYKACKVLHVKTISVYHNDPGQNTWVQNCNQQLQASKNPVKRLFLRSKRLIWKAVSSYLMHYAYIHSDYYMLLSKHFIPAFCSVAKIKDSSRILVQNNPITLDRGNIDMEKEREKIILYVGRLEEGQKCVSRVFLFWKLLQPKLPEWKLVMVGDGPDRAMYEQFVQENGLKNVVFEGFQKPDSYYQKAPILVMTSDYEGWPLILGECKAYGCVPVVLGSFLSVSELINSENDGIIMPMPFDENEWANSILSLVQTPRRLKDMSLLAERNSHNFDIDLIYKQWEEKFKMILNS